MRRAQALAPESLKVLRASASLDRLLRGFSKSTVDLDRRALEQDPLNVQCYRSLAFSQLEAENFGEAEQLYRKALELSPKTIIVRGVLGLMLLELGRPEEALAAAREEPAPWHRLTVLALISIQIGNVAESDAALQELIRDDGRRNALVQIASVYAVRGEADPAFEWLERAYTHRDPGMFTIVRSKRYMPSLKSDPRWPVFMRKLGLDP